MAPGANQIYLFAQEILYTNCSE